MVTDEQIATYYKKFKNFMQWFLHASSYKIDRTDITDELLHDIFLAVLQNKNTIEDLPRYTWGIMRNRLKMLYRSADYNAEKQPFLDNGEFIKTHYDEDMMCAIIDGGAYENTEENKDRAA
jgi:hypothetical protein